MHIEHLALWTRDLDRLKAFYETYFGASANERYRSKRRPFESYFLTFVTGARLELMSLEGIDEARSETALGYAHLALSTGSSPSRASPVTDTMRAWWPIPTATRSRSRPDVPAPTPWRHDPPPAIIGAAPPRDRRDDQACPSPPPFTAACRFR
jgi:lactoylglutathione lyase